FRDNPFLPHFYENPGRYALPVELFFMTERYRQLNTKLNSGHYLFAPAIIADYFFDKTLLFACQNLTALEFRLFHQLYDTLAPHLRTPDIVIYLHRPIHQLKENIQQRGRPYEQQISDRYLQSIQDAYFDYFRIDRSYPVVIVNAENLHFMEDEHDFLRLVELLKRTYPKGVHRVSFVH
ncbi:MAG TPA: deoxynucleoside kinase, partial [Membranihabitans sp.]|nr:deoxynucleoside kinase [Membranihabitans sp.]